MAVEAEDPPNHSLAAHLHRLGAARCRLACALQQRLTLPLCRTRVAHLCRMACHESSGIKLRDAAPMRHEVRSSTAYTLSRRTHVGYVRGAPCRPLAWLLPHERS